MVYCVQGDGFRDTSTMHVCCTVHQSSVQWQISVMDPPDKKIKLDPPHEVKLKLKWTYDPHVKY